VVWCSDTSTGVGVVWQEWSVSNYEILFLVVGETWIEINYETPVDRKPAVFFSPGR
jgi:hypothetical protein